MPAKLKPSYWLRPGYWLRKGAGKLLIWAGKKLGKRVAGVALRKIGAALVKYSLKQLFKKGLFISNNTIDRTTSEYIKKLSIRLHSSKQAVRSLSGGNQQKVVLAKWLLLQPSVLILDEPTRGVDVGAKAEIYQLLGELVSKGITIILISSDLPELIGLSDRIVVMSEGRIVKVLEQEEATPHQVMYYAGLNEKTAEVVNERNLQP